jgi:phosphoribosyl-ATP pyrophosphohydrolase/phosphoribosyl-AMP cyclohydrolase
MKGESSGNVLDVSCVRYDCDADSFLLTVDLRGKAACHTGQRTCFYRSLPMASSTRVSSAAYVPRLGDVLSDLADVLEQRKRDLPEGSYTTKLLSGPQDKLLKKIAEESGEVIIAARDHDLPQTRYEAADLLYHLLVVLVREGIPVEELATELSGRVGLPPRQ